MPDDSSEPDKVYRSSPLSRRDALTLGGAGLTTALAGCSEMLNSSTGNPSNSPQDGDDETRDQTPTESPVDTPPTVHIQNDDILQRTESERPPKRETRTHSNGELLTKTEFGIFPKEETREHIRDGGTVEYIVRLYTSPLYKSGRTKLAEKTVQKQSREDIYEITYEIPEDHLNEAQQFIYTVETRSPEQADEKVGYKTGNILVPFENQARDETSMRVVGTPYPNQSLWFNELEPTAKVEVWFNEPDESPFNKPDDLDMSEYYPTEWYGEYTDLEITMLVRYPIYEVMVDQDHPAYDQIRDERERDRPMYDWAVFNFNVAEIEMIEARRWNSYTIQQIERGRFELSDDGQTAISDDGHAEWDTHAGQGGLITDGTFYQSGDATDTPEPFEQYYRSRYAPYSEGGTQNPANSPINPIKFAGGRPVIKRWAMEMEDSLANNSNFQEHEAPEYYKATILKAIIGSAPYAFGIGPYRNTPAELINNWYRNASTEAPLGGNCVAASMFFAGVGVHLLDSPVGLVHMGGDNIAHLQAGIIGLELPSYLPEDVNDDKAKEPLDPEDRKYHTEFGPFFPVECNFQGAVIGYEERVGAEHFLRFNAYATNMDINSHIPVNEDYEPDIDGEVLADRDPEQNAYLFRNTVVNPSPRPWFEDYQE